MDIVADELYSASLDGGIEVVGIGQTPRRLRVAGGWRVRPRDAEGTLEPGSPAQCSRISDTAPGLRMNVRSGRPGRPLLDGVDAPTVLFSVAESDDVAGLPAQQQHRPQSLYRE